MKLVATKIDYLTHSNGDMIINLTIPQKHYISQKTMLKTYDELKVHDMLNVEIKKHYKSRTLNQNNWFWKLVDLITLEQTGSTQESEKMHVYGQILVEANVDRVYLRTFESATHILEQQFRAVVKIPQSMEKAKNGEITYGYWCYIGSSRFDTKEMGIIIEIAERWCSELGINITLLEREKIKKRKNIYDKQIKIIELYNKCDFNKPKISLDPFTKVYNVAMNNFINELKKQGYRPKLTHKYLLNLILKLRKIDKAIYVNLRYLFLNDPTRFVNNLSLGIECIVKVVDEVYVKPTYNYDEDEDDEDEDY